MPEWISCAERLPENDRGVLFCTYYGTMHIGRKPQYGMCWTSSSSRIFAGNDVTHWMDLPDPPDKALKINTLGQQADTTLAEFQRPQSMKLRHGITLPDDPPCTLECCKPLPSE